MNMDLCKKVLLLALVVIILLLVFVLFGGSLEGLVDKSASTSLFDRFHSLSEGFHGGGHMYGSGGMPRYGGVPHGGAYWHPGWTGGNHSTRVVGVPVVYDEPQYTEVCKLCNGVPCNCEYIPNAVSPRMIIAP